MVQENVSSRLVSFQIRLAGTGAVYANGRHQCEVVIEVVREVVNDLGQWQPTALSDAERASVTVARLSNASVDALPQGWNCDEGRNKYSTGLWPSGVDSQAETREPDPLADTISRFLRTDQPFTDECIELIAVIYLDGARYTTADTAGSGSSVTITRASAYGLPVSALELYRDPSAFSESVTLLTVYYWVPPKDIWFVESLGIDTPAEVSDEGEHFHTVEVFPYGLGSLGYKLGVVINKNDPALPLRMDDVHKNLPLSVPNPFIRFNERPTIMRAIALVAPGLTTASKGEGLWRLIDNFGNEHRYFLSYGNGVELEHRPGFRITTLFITLPSGHDYTNALYANGLHQCKVRIELVLEEEDFNGDWAPVKLTKQQRESVTVTQYSANRDQPLPAGWHVDKVKNIYDEGLWRGGGVEPEGVGDEQISQVSGETVESIDLYMRFDAGVPIETMKFMARVIINGVPITTNYAEGDQIFDSSINILPTRPYTLDVSRLSSASYNSFEDDTVNIAAYYWRLPDGLLVFESKGLDDRIYQEENEGSDFLTSYATNNGLGGNSIKAGVMRRLTYPGAQVRVSNIHKRLYGSATTDPLVKVDHVNTRMFALRLTAKKGEFARTGDSKGKWRVLDNFGCEHVYWLSHTDGWSRLVLNNG